MLKQSFYIVFLIGLSLIVACIDPIELEQAEEEPLIVINGKITNVPGEQYVSVKRSALFVAGPEGIEATVNASVKVMDDLGGVVEFIDLDNDGFYLPPDNYTGEIGRSYQVEVNADGKTYTSELIKLNPVPEIDTLFVATETIETINNAGNTTFSTRVNLFTNTILPDTGIGTYLRWRTSGEYELSEVSSPSNLNIQTCWIKEEVDFDNIAIASSRENSDGTLEGQKILARPVDYRFAARYCFHVTQESITPDAYRYWKEVNSEIDRTGSIFETPPSRIVGNISNPDDAKEVVLGFFNVSALSTKKAFIRPEMVSNPRPLCTPFPTPPAVCFDCTIRANSSLDRPDYWQ